jgi:putative restriction endonuclease
MDGKADRRQWSREEHVLAFNLYCKIPFGTIHMRNPRVVELAELIGRSSGAVSYKLANFARLDPAQHERGIRGFEHGAKGEIDIWNEYSANPEALAFESERLLAEYCGTTIENISEISELELPREGLERERLVRQRVNQAFFRKTILAAYNFTCCITGISVHQLLIASHIAPWSMDTKNRMNPRNGLCLNALHDRAFDRGLMSVSRDGTIRFAKTLLKDQDTNERELSWLVSFDGQQIRKPNRFHPDQALLAEHYEKVFG